MKKKTKAANKFPEKLKSSGSGVPTTVAPIGLSGRYITLARAGKLTELGRLRKEAGKLLQERTEIENNLFAYNDRNSLDEFAALMRRRGRDFETALREVTTTLENRRKKINARLETKRQRIVAIDPSLVGQPLTTLALPVALMSTNVATPHKRGPNARHDVSCRNFIIRKYPDLPGIEICKKLDAELPRRDGLMDGLLEKWKVKYGVSTFTAAYKNSDCRALVHKMIHSGKKDI